MRTRPWGTDLPALAHPTPHPQPLPIWQQCGAEMGSESPICWEGKEKKWERGKGKRRMKGEGEEKEEQREGEE